jgi:TPR repeat protein
MQTAAERGSPQARAQLAAMYATGNCAPFDRAMAYNWFTLALNAQPHNALFARNRQMLWQDMTEEERQRVREAVR